MTHVIEPASTGRARCRGCERTIDKGELRFGERQPNPFGDGEMTLWFHTACAAYKRPEPFLEAAREAELGELGERERARLVSTAEHGVEHRRLPRLNGAQRSPTGRARCRNCRELIPRKTWRIALVFFEELRFEPSGFIHAGCAGEYFGTTELIERIAHFSPELEQADLDEVRAAIAAQNRSGE